MRERRAPVLSVIRHAARRCVEGETSNGQTNPPVPQPHGGNGEESDFEAVKSPKRPGRETLAPERSDGQVRSGPRPSPMAHQKLEPRGYTFNPKSLFSFVAVVG